MGTMSQNVRHPYVGKYVSLVSASNTSEFVVWLFGTAPFSARFKDHLSG